MEEPAELSGLRTLLRRVAAHTGVAPGAVDWQLGFAVFNGFEKWDYHNTPVNSIAFAATGGDGIHIGLVTDGPADGAVVLTVPPGDIPNTILASSFADFLRLGYYAGFYWLEELGYAWAEADELYRKPSRHLDDVGWVLIGELRSTFRLQPIDSVASHLAGLEAKYGSALVLPNIEEWSKRHGV